jgi:hypothetical protein
MEHAAAEVDGAGQLSTVILGPRPEHRETWGTRHTMLVNNEKRCFYIVERES